MKILLTIMFVAASGITFGSSVQESELIGTWVPSGEMTREKDSFNYSLTINKNFNGIYKAIGGNLELQCEYKPSNTQNSIFIFYCFLDKKHLITLSLGGWVSGNGYKQIYGYEYWLGGIKSGHIHGGLPVSLKIKGK